MTADPPAGQAIEAALKFAGARAKHHEIEADAKKSSGFPNLALEHSRTAQHYRTLLSLHAQNERMREALREINEIAESNGVEDLAMGDLLDQMDLISLIVGKALNTEDQP